MFEWGDFCSAQVIIVALVIITIWAMTSKIDKVNKFWIVGVAISVISIWLTVLNTTGIDLFDIIFNGILAGANWIWDYFAGSNAIVLGIAPLGLMASNHRDLKRDIVGANTSLRVISALGIVIIPLIYLYWSNLPDSQEFVIDHGDFIGLIVSVASILLALILIWTAGIKNRE